MIGRRKLSMEQRFWQKVDISNGCWVWTASLDDHGYGRFRVGGRKDGRELKAHRMAWILTCGPISETQYVLHHCDNPPCVNPTHLFLGTKKDNTQDMLKKNRGSAPPVHYGEQHHNTKFNEQVARNILLDSRPANVIALELGVNPITIKRLRKGQSWLQLHVK